MHIQVMIRGVWIHSVSPFIYSRIKGLMQKLVTGNRLGSKKLRVADIRKLCHLHELGPAFLRYRRGLVSSEPFTLLYYTSWFPRFPRPPERFPLAIYSSSQRRLLPSRAPP